MITFSNIVDRFEKFVEGHHFLKSFSYGSPEDLDLDKETNFPLLHLVYTTGNYASKTKTYSFEVYILDLPHGKEHQKEFEKDTITRSEQAAEDIIADLEMGGVVFDFDYAYELESASVTPLEEEGSNVLAGTMLNVAISVPYLYDACNAPLQGVSPQGTDQQPYVARGLLRIKEEDGSPDVTTVKTIVVSNDSLTDNGNGEVTLNTGGSPFTGGLTTTYDYSAPPSTERYVNTTGGVYIQACSLGQLSEVTFATRQLVGAHHIVHNQPLSRRELHGLSSGTQVTVRYELYVNWSASGLISIDSIAPTPSLNLTLNTTGIGSEFHTLEGTFEVNAVPYLFLNLRVLSTMNCEVSITRFKVTATNPS